MTDSPATDPAPLTASASTAPTCGNMAYLPTALVPLALAAHAEGTYGREDVQRQLRCGLEKHHDGAHHGFVMELAGADSGSVWTRWVTDAAPEAVVVLPDCDGRTEDGKDVCEEFAGHPGRHTWQLEDPWHNALA